MPDVLFHHTLRPPGSFASIWWTSKRHRFLWTATPQRRLISLSLSFPPELGSIEPFYHDQAFYLDRTWAELLESLGTPGENNLPLFPDVNKTMSYEKLHWTAAQLDACFELELYAVPIRTFQQACLGYRGFGTIRRHKPAAR